MSELDRKGLAEEFDLEDTEEIEIETFRNVLNKTKQLEDPNNVLTTIIEKAGTFLDMIERESVNGGMSARYMEVASAILNSLMTAANSIATINSVSFNDELKEKRIEQRDEELKIKRLYYEGKQQSLEGGNNTQNNMIVTDFNSVMKFLENNKQTQIENNIKE